MTAQRSQQKQRTFALAYGQDDPLLSTQTGRFTTTGENTSNTPRSDETSSKELPLEGAQVQFLSDRVQRIAEVAYPNVPANSMLVSMDFHEDEVIFSVCTESGTQKHIVSIERVLSLPEVRFEMYLEGVALSVKHGYIPLAKDTGDSTLRAKSLMQEFENRNIKLLRRVMRLPLKLSYHPELLTLGNSTQDLAVYNKELNFTINEAEYLDYTFHNNPVAEVTMDAEPFFLPEKEFQAFLDSLVTGNHPATDDNGYIVGVAVPKSKQSNK